MKKLTVTLVPESHPDSVGSFQKALNSIRSNPSSHGYTQKEVIRVMKLEAEIEKSVKPLEGFKQLAELPEKMRVTIDRMGLILRKSVVELKHVSSRGWFISPNIVFDYPINELVNKVRKENAEKLEKQIIMENKQAKRIKSLLLDCKKIFSHRSEIFDEITKLYERKMYSSLIALCYTQADGMCNDVWNIGFFDKDKNNGHKIRLHDELDNNEKAISSYFIHQLGYSNNEMIMWAKHEYFNNDSIKKSSFNRHLIMHGHSTNFGTQVNAIRAILLLDFINFFASEKSSES